MKKEQGLHPFSKSNKIYYFIPLAILPFTTLLFWALGGGGGGAEATEVGGLNTSLPAAKVKEGDGFNRLSFYERVVGNGVQPTPPRDSTLVKHDENYSYDPSPHGIPGYSDEEQNLTRKLETLSKNLSSQETKNASQPSPQVPKTLASTDEPSFTPSEDKELSAINDLMDKVIRIQDPHTGKTIANKKSKDKQGERTSITLLQVEENNAAQKSFFGIAHEGEDEESSEGRTVAVAVDGDQSIGGGSTIKLRLKEELTVRDKRILPGTILWGLTSISGNLLSIQVRSIRSGNNIISLSGTIWDEDGLPGIRMPRAFGANIEAGENNHLFDIDTYSLQDAPVRSRVAQAGIESIKSLVRKGSKQHKIKIPSGYNLYLQFND